MRAKAAQVFLVKVITSRHQLPRTLNYRNYKTRADLYSFLMFLSFYLLSLLYFFLIFIIFNFFLFSLIHLLFYFFIFLISPTGTSKRGNERVNRALRFKSDHFLLFLIFPSPVCLFLFGPFARSVLRLSFPNARAILYKSKNTSSKIPSIERKNTKAKM